MELRQNQLRQQVANLTSKQKAQEIEYLESQSHLKELQRNFIQLTQENRRNYQSAVEFKTQLQERTEEYHTLKELNTQKIKRLREKLITKTHTNKLLTEQFGALSEVARKLKVNVAQLTQQRDELQQRLVQQLEVVEAQQQQMQSVVRENAARLVEYFEESRSLLLQSSVQSSATDTTQLTNVLDELADVQGGEQTIELLNEDAARKRRVAKITSDDGTVVVAVADTDIVTANNEMFFPFVPVNDMDRELSKPQYFMAKGEQEE